MVALWPLTPPSLLPPGPLLVSRLTRAPPAPSPFPPPSFPVARAPPPPSRPAGGLPTRPSGVEVVVPPPPGRRWLAFGGLRDGEVEVATGGVGGGKGPRGMVRGELGGLRGFGGACLRAVVPAVSERW